MIIPAAFIGFAGLADGIGPRGWLGLLEFLGWVVICAAAGFFVGFLLVQWRRDDARRFFALPLAAVALAAFTYVTSWLGLGAPMWAKVIFTTSLQFVGSFLIVGIVIWMSFGIWDRLKQ